MPPPSPGETAAGQSTLSETAVPAGGEAEARPRPKKRHQKRLQRPSGDARLANKRANQGEPEPREADKPLSGSQTPLSGSQHRRGGASGSSTHGRVCGDQQTLRGRAEDHRPERGAVKITGLQGWHSRSERQNRCNTDQRPEVGAIRIMSAGTGAIRIMSAEIGAIDIMKPSRAQSRALDRVAHARPVAHALVAGRWRRAGHRRHSRARRRRGWQS